MKQSKSVLVVVAFLCLPAGYTAADVTSLRGSENLLTTNAAPKNLKYVKDKENVPRTFKEQPPVIPHLAEKYEVNLTKNKCLDCHTKKPGKDEAKSVEIPDSHFIGRDGKKLDKMAGNRYFCTQCHVPQVDAKPLVASTFETVKMEK